MARKKVDTRALGKLTAAAASKSTALKAVKAEIVERESGGLLLPDEIDLSTLADLKDGQLVDLIGEDLTAIEELESQSFRHAVRAAASFAELERRERERLAATGERFRRGAWAERILGTYFAGRITYRTMKLYEQVSTPESIRHAQEFDRKIRKMRALKEAGKSGEDLLQAATAQGIPVWEAEIIPEQFSLRRLREYLIAQNRAVTTKTTKTKTAEELLVSIECSAAIADDVELAVRRAIAKFAVLPKGATKQTGKDLSAKGENRVKRRLGFPEK